MPKQVWQSEDGKTFESESECTRYESLYQALSGLFSYSNTQSEAEELLGFQEEFGETLKNGFFTGVSSLWEYKESIIKLAKMLEG